jgi:hypothetical protein
VPEACGGKKEEGREERVAAEEAWRAKDVVIVKASGVVQTEIE